MKKIITILIVFFSLAAHSQIVQGEFFWDTDPGQGNGTALIAEDGNFDNELETLIHQSSASLTVGMHILNVRIKDSLDWSPVFRTLVRVDEAFSTTMSHISMAEYFIDTDPGEGNGTAIVAFDGNYNDALETAIIPNINTVAEGLHTLGIRVKDSVNNWSPVFKTVFKADGYFNNWKKPQISVAEYYIDNDPGMGLATPMIAFDGTFNDAIETVSVNFSSNLTNGLHIIGFRVKDINNNWCEPFETVIYAEPCPTVSIPTIADTSICANQTIQIEAPEGFNSYVWSDGSTSATISIEMVGTYTLTVTDENGCTGSTDFYVAPNGIIQGQWTYAKGVYSSNADLIQATDNKGNIYLASICLFDTDSLTFNGETIKASGNNSQVLVLKLNKNFEKLWMQRIEMPSSDMRPMRTMTVDNDGNMFFGGNNSNSFTYNDSTYRAMDYYIVKVDSFANIIWISTGGHTGTGGDMIYDLECKNDKLIALGRIERDGDINFGGSTYYSGSDGSFLMEMNANTASVNWVNFIGKDYMTQHFEIDKERNIYVTGHYRSQYLKINNIEIPISQNNQTKYSNYLLKFDANGTFKWARVFFEMTSKPLLIGVANPNSILVIGDWGYGQTKIDIDTSTIYFPAGMNGGNFVAKFDNLGVLTNSKTTQIGNSTLTAIANNQYFVSGIISGTSAMQIFGNDTIAVSTNDPGYNHAFFGIIDNDLNGLSGYKVIGEYSTKNKILLSDNSISFIGTIPTKIDYPYYELDTLKFTNNQVAREQNNQIFAVFNPNMLLPWDTLQLASDTSICAGEEITLNAPAGYSEYSWSNGVNNQSITLNQTSTITLSTTESHGCPLISDQFNLTVNLLPTPNLGNDTTIQTNESITLNPGNFSYYLWSNQTSNSSLLVDGSQLTPAIYSYTVTVTDQNSCQNSDQIFVTVDLTIGIKENDFIISVSPNPSSDFINIKTNKSINHIDIFNNSGHLVYACNYSNSEEVKLDLKSFSSGFYLIKIATADNLKEIKILKK